MQNQASHHHITFKYCITLLMTVLFFSTPLWAQSRTQVFESTQFAHHMNQWKQQVTQSRSRTKAWNVRYTKRNSVIENQVNTSYLPVTWMLYKTMSLPNQEEILMDFDFSFHNSDYKAMNVNLVYQNRKYNLYTQMQAQNTFQRQTLDLSQFRGKKVRISIELYKNYRVKARQAGLSLKSVRIYTPSKPAPNLDVNIASFYLNELDKRDLVNQIIPQSLAKMLHTFDITLLQNIADQDGQVISVLLNLLNRSQADMYSVAMIPVGHINKDQTLSAYIYRTDKFQLLRNQLIRELVGYLQNPVHQITVKHVVSGQVLNLLGTHLNQSNVAEEMLDLNEYVDTRINHLNSNEELLILGNLNADCEYFNQEQRMTHPMLNNENLYLHIPHQTNSVLGADTCQYDRILSSMIPANQITNKNSNYVIQSDVLDYTQVWNIPSVIAYQISKHLPVWTKIRLHNR